MDIIHSSYYVHGLGVMKLIFAVLDVSFNNGHFTMIIKRQFLKINICSFSTIFIYMLALVMILLELNASLGEEGQNLTTKQKRLLVW